MSNKEITVEMVEKAGLIPEDLDLIRDTLGRAPNITELYIFSAIWRDDIKYPGIRGLIQPLYETGASLLSSGDETMMFADAGDKVLCLSADGLYYCDKAEGSGSYSAGLISRTDSDIAATGAIPVARLYSLHLGDINENKEKSSTRDIVHDIGVGSSILGIPVAGGESFFDQSNNSRQAFNCITVGIADKKRDETTRDIIGKGDRIYFAGIAADICKCDNATDSSITRIHGNCREKLLQGAVTDISGSGICTNISGIGKGSISGALAEMSCKAKTGIRFDLDSTRLNDNIIEPYEAICSPMPGSILVAVEKGKEDMCEDIFKKWGLDFTTAGEFTGDDSLQVYYNKELLADIPVLSFYRESGKKKEAPEIKAPEYIKDIEKYSVDNIPEPDDLREIASKMVNNPNNASKKCIYRNYDIIGGFKNISEFKDTDSGIIDLKGSEKALFLTCDSNSRYGQADPDTGSLITVAEAARNIICSGGKPVAMACCLNTGNRYDAEARWQLAGAAKGIAEASRKFGIPVAYSTVNCLKKKPSDNDPAVMFPSAVIAMTGIIEKKNRVMTMGFKRKGAMIYLIGRSNNDISSSEYLVSCHDTEYSPLPFIDSDHEYELHNVVRDLISKDLVDSAHDISRGGLFITMIESCMSNDLGFDITSDAEIRRDAFLFGESQSRIVISVDPEHETEFLDFMIEKNFPFSTLGHVTKGELRVDDISYGFIKDIKAIYETTLEKYKERD